MCHRLGALHDGRVAADGPPAEVVTPDLLHDVFRVHARVVPDGDVPLLAYDRPAIRDHVSPYDAQARKGGNSPVPGHQRDRFEHALGGDHPVERVAVMPVEQAGGECMVGRDGKLSGTQPLEMTRIAVHDGLRLVELPEPELRADLPRAGG